MGPSPPRGRIHSAGLSKVRGALGRRRCGRTEQGRWLPSQLPASQGAVHSACPLPSRASRAVLWIPGPSWTSRAHCLLAFPDSHIPPEAHQTASICRTVDSLGSHGSRPRGLRQGRQLSPEPSAQPFACSPIDALEKPEVQLVLRVLKVASVITGDLRRKGVTGPDLGEEDGTGTEDGRGAPGAAAQGPQAINTNNAPCSSLSWFPHHTEQAVSSFHPVLHSGRARFMSGEPAQQPWGERPLSANTAPFYRGVKKLGNLH